MPSMIHTAIKDKLGPALIAGCFKGKGGIRFDGRLKNVVGSYLKTRLGVGA